MIKGLDVRLRVSRINRGLTRKQVAELIDVSESLIGLYESGNRQPSLIVLIKLCAIYKVTADYLLGCESMDKSVLSLDGLTDKQIQALTLTAECFRNSIS